jgi:hypothetical protein
MFSFFNAVLQGLEQTICNTSNAFLLVVCYTTSMQPSSSAEPKKQSAASSLGRCVGALCLYQLLKTRFGFERGPWQQQLKRKITAD